MNVYIIMEICQTRTDVTRTDVTDRQRQTDKERKEGNKEERKKK